MTLCISLIRYNNYLLGIMAHYLSDKIHTPNVSIMQHTHVTNLHMWGLLNLENLEKSRKSRKKLEFIF